VIDDEHAAFGRVSVKQEPRAEGVSAELQVTAAESGDSGSYYCEASNLFGRDRQLLQLQVQGIPFLDLKDEL